MNDTLRSSSENKPTPNGQAQTPPQEAPTQPAADASAAPAEAEEKKPGTLPKRDPAEVDLASVSALVVEDDAGGMAIIGVMLRHLHINAYINTSGEGVVQMAKAMRPRPDIIFCDINLPTMTGYDVLDTIRNDPALRDTPVIAVTAQDADTEIPKARAAGFNGYIGKPLNRMRFPKQLRRILAGEAVWETY